MAATSKSGRTISINLGAWYSEKDGHIRFRVEGQGLTSVSNDPKSERYHRTLYDKLDKALRQAGAKAPSISTGGTGMGA